MSLIRLLLVYLSGVAWVKYLNKDDQKFVYIVLTIKTGT